jgi:hypothetical protein
MAAGLLQKHFKWPNSSEGPTSHFSKALMRSWQRTVSNKQSSSAFLPHVLLFFKNIFYYIFSSITFPMLSPKSPIPSPPPLPYPPIPIFLALVFPCTANGGARESTQGAKGITCLTFNCLLFEGFFSACLSVCLHIMCVLGAYRCQKRTSDPLELELQADVSHHVDARTQILCKISK